MRATFCRCSSLSRTVEDWHNSSGVLASLHELCFQPCESSAQSTRSKATSEVNYRTQPKGGCGRGSLGVRRVSTMDMQRLNLTPVHRISLPGTRRDWSAVLHRFLQPLRADTATPIHRCGWLLGLMFGGAAYECDDELPAMAIFEHLKKV